MSGATKNNILELAGVASIARLVEDPAIHECLQWFGAEKRWTDQIHLELCRIPAPTFQEDERAAWMADRFREMGYSVRIDRAGNVIAGNAPSSTGPFIAVSAHLDTVLAPRKPEDISVNGTGRLEGPGVADNGCGLVGLLALARVLRHHDLLGEELARILFVANVGEEGEGNLSGMRFLCRRSEMGERIQTFLVLDGPATDRITARAVASRRFEIRVDGPGGHSWSDFGIANPVHALSRAVTIFTDDVRNGRIEPSSNRTTFNFGVIEGGASVNAIPSRASAKLDLRSENLDEIEKMVSLLTSALERALGTEHSQCDGPRLNARVREIGSRPGGALSPCAPILQFLRAVDAHLGIRSIEDCASTDANIPLSLGRQAVSIGAGGSGGGAHTPGEWYDPESREIGLQRVLLLLYLLAKAAGSPD